MLTSDQVPQPIPALAEVRELAAERDWRSLVARLRDAGPDELLAEPEIGFLFADACHRIGEAERALATGTAVETRVRSTGDRRLLLRVLNVVGMSLFEMGRMDDAELRFGELLDRASEWGDEEFAARASNNLGVLANVRGRRDLALTCYQRALAAYQRCGNLRGLAQTHYNLGLNYRELGFFREADSHYQHSIRLGERSRSEDVVALAESDRGLLHVQMGDPPMGEAFARRARDRFERLSDPVRRAETLRVLAAAARAEDRAPEAAALLAEALAVARQHSHHLLHAEVQRDRGLLLRDLGEAAAACDALQDAADHFERIGAAAEAAAAREAARTARI